MVRDLELPHATVHDTGPSVLIPQQMDVKTAPNPLDN